MGLRGGLCYMEFKVLATLKIHILVGYIMTLCSAVII
jgi:hypothetical protein